MSAWLAVAGRAVVVAVGKALVWMFGDPEEAAVGPARRADEEQEKPD